VGRLFKGVCWLGGLALALERADLPLLCKLPPTLTRLIRAEKSSNWGFHKAAKAFYPLNIKASSETHINSKATVITIKVWRGKRKPFD